MTRVLSRHWSLDGAGQEPWTNDRWEMKNTASGTISEMKVAGAISSTVPLNCRICRRQR